MEKKLFWDSLPEDLHFSHKITASDKCIEEQLKRICTLENEHASLTAKAGLLDEALKIVEHCATDGAEINTCVKSCCNALLTRAKELNNG